MKISEKVRNNLRRLTDAEYEQLQKDHPPKGYSRNNMQLGRVTDEEYQQMSERSENE